MIIILDKSETIEMAQIAIEDIGNDPNKLERLTRAGLFYKTDIPHDELKLMVEVYIQ